MKQKLTHNLNLKVLAVLFSIIIWVIVVNIDDPVKSVQFNEIPIQLVNESVLTKKNLVCEVKDENTTVDVTVTGRRSVIEDLSKDNIIVTADIDTLDDDNRIALKVTANKYSGDIDSMRPEFDKVELNIEELKKIQKVIQVETIGEPAEDYIKGDYSVSLNRVNIEGPKSIIDMIQSAKVQIDVEGATNSVSASAPIILYDSLGQIVDSSRLKMNLDNISVSQEILYTKTVNIVCNPSGEPEEGFKTTGDVVISPSEVTLAGPRAVLDNINQVTIPGSAVNVTGQNSAYRTNVNIFNYLPSSVETTSDDFRGNVTVTVDIEQEISKTYNIYLNKVSLDALPKDYTAEIINGAESATDNRIELEVYGLQKEFDNVTSADIQLKADFDRFLEDNNMESLRTGVFTIPVEVNLPDGLRIDKDVKIRVRLTTDET